MAPASGNVHRAARGRGATGSSRGQTDRGVRQDRRRKVWVRWQGEGLVPSCAAGMSSGSQPRGRAGPDASPRVRGERRAGQIPRSGAPASGQESPRYRDECCTSQDPTHSQVCVNTNTQLLANRAQV